MRSASAGAAVDAAKRLRSVVMSPARHPDVQRLQNVFRDTRLQCWQWLVGPEVPAENNRSEREVRPLAAARKSSHGSQSDRGAERMFAPGMRAAERRARQRPAFRRLRGPE